MALLLLVFYHYRKLNQYRIPVICLLPVRMARPGGLAVALIIGNHFLKMGWIPSTVNPRRSYQFAVAHRIPCHLRGCCGVCVRKFFKTGWLGLHKSSPGVTEVVCPPCQEKIVPEDAWNPICTSHVFISLYGSLLNFLSNTLPPLFNTSSAFASSCWVTKIILVHPFKWAG